MRSRKGKGKEGADNVLGGIICTVLCKKKLISMPISKASSLSRLNEIIHTDTHEYVLRYALGELTELLLLLLRFCKEKMQTDRQVLSGPNCERTTTATEVQTQTEKLGGSRRTTLISCQGGTEGRE